MLPAIRSSSDRAGYGVTRRSGPVGGEVPVSGDLGDQQAATVGQVCVAPGEAKNTYGTGNFMLLNTGREIVPSKAGLLTTVCYRMGDAAPIYALEGSIAVTGSAVQWLRDQLGIIGSAAEIEALATSVPDNGGTYFVPAFSGLFAPYWRSDARGAIVGLSRFNTKAHLARATLEAICFQTRAVLDAMVKDSGVESRDPESRRRRDGEQRADADAGRHPRRARWCGPSSPRRQRSARPMQPDLRPASGEIWTIFGRTGRWIGSGSRAGPSDQRDTRVRWLGKGGAADAQLDLRSRRLALAAGCWAGWPSRAQRRPAI